MKTRFLLSLLMFVFLFSNGQKTFEDLNIKSDNIAYLSKSDKPYSGKLEGIYSENQWKYKGVYKNGLKEKLWTEWDKDGMKRLEISYKTGLRNGVFRKWYDYGQLQEEGTYSSGRRIGEWIEWDVLGKNKRSRIYKTKKEFFDKEHIKIEGTLKDGKKHDNWIEYNQEGQRLSESWYNEGVKEGLEILWHINGKVYKRRVFKNNVKVGHCTEYYENGEKKRVGEFDDKGFPTGEWTYYNESGKLDKKETYKTEVKYFPNGDKMQLSQYKNGKKDGEWTWWFDNGQKKFQETYKLDAPDGQWVWWYENGVVESEGYYKAGTKEELWVWKYLNGNKKESGVFSKGNKNGIWLTWYTKGEKEDEITYKNGYV